MALEDTTSQTANRRQAIQLRLDHLSDFVRVRPPHRSADSPARQPEAGHPDADHPGASHPGASQPGASQDASAELAAPSAPRHTAPLPEDGIPTTMHTNGPSDGHPPMRGQAAATDHPPLPPWPRAGFWARDPAGPRGAGHTLGGASRELAISNQADRAVALRVADFGSAVEDLANALGGIEGGSPLLSESLRGAVRDGPDVDVRTWLHGLLHVGRVAAPALRDALLSGDQRAARARAEQVLLAAPTVTGCARIAAVLALGTADTTTPGTPARAAPLFYRALATRSVAHSLDRLREDLGVVERWLADNTRAHPPVHLEPARSPAWALVPRPPDAHAGMNLVPWTPYRTPHPSARGGVPAVARIPFPPARRPPGTTNAPAIPGLPRLDDVDREPTARGVAPPGAAAARVTTRLRRREALGVPYHMLPEVVAARPDIRQLWLLSTAVSLLLLGLALTVQIAGPGLAGGGRPSTANHRTGAARAHAARTVAVVPTTVVGETPAAIAASPSANPAATTASTTIPAAPPVSAAVVPLASTLNLRCAGGPTTLGLHNPTGTPQSWTLTLPPGVRTDGMRGVVNPGKTLTIRLWPDTPSRAAQATATLNAAGGSVPVVLNIPSC